MGKDCTFNNGAETTAFVENVKLEVQLTLYTNSIPCDVRTNIKGKTMRTVVKIQKIFLL